MDQPMKKFLRAGMILHVLYPEIGGGKGPILDRLQHIVDDTYFDAVEINSIRDRGIRDQAAQIMHDAKLTISLGAQGKTLGAGISLSSLDEAERQRAVAAVKEGIDDAKAMGAVNCQFMSGSYDVEQKEACYQQLLRSTRELCAYAREAGVPLVCEIFDYDVDKKALIGPAPLAAKYAEEITKEFPEFGLQVDLSHIPLLHEGIRETVTTLRPYIKHVHIGNGVVCKESEAYGDTHPRFGFPMGSNDAPEVAEFLRALIDTGYINETDRPIVSFEVKPWKDEDSAIVLANAKRTLDEAWVMV